MRKLVLVLAAAAVLTLGVGWGGQYYLSGVGDMTQAATMAGYGG